MGGVVREARRHQCAGFEGADCHLGWRDAPLELWQQGAAQGAKLCGKEEGFDDRALLLQERKKIQRVLEKAYAASLMTNEEVFDGVFALGKANMHGWASGTSGNGYEKSLGKVHKDTKKRKVRGKWQGSTLSRR